jgi:peptide deformylase
VTRAQHVSVSALDLDGNRLAYDAEDLEARVIQHEIDHLDGVLFIDRIDDPLRREARRILRERALGTAAVPRPTAPAARI